MTKAKVIYRHTILKYPKLPPFHILEYKNGDWHWLFSTQDAEFFNTYIGRTRTKISETLHVDEK